MKRNVGSSRPATAGFMAGTSFALSGPEVGVPKVVIPETVSGKLPAVCVLTGRIDDVAYFSETFTQPVS